MRVIKMGKLDVLLVFIVALASLSGLSFAWSPLAGYRNAFNVSVSSWSYAQSYDNGNYAVTYPNATFILVSLNSSYGNAKYYSIRGYDSVNKDIGAVNYTIVNRYGNTSILIYNLTSSGRKWSRATIFFNPIFANKLGSIDGSRFSVFHLVAQPSPFVLGYQKTYNLTLGSPIPSLVSGNPFNDFNKYVVLANSDLSQENISITYSPTNFANIRIKPANAFYIVSSDGIFGGANVLGAPMVSDNAKSLFNQLIITGTPNYEGSFDTSSVYNWVMDTEGMSANAITGNLINATTSIKMTNIYYYHPLIDINLKTNNTLDITALPMFSRGYSLGGIMNFTDADIPLSEFRHYINITNITYSYNFPTYALPTHIGNLTNVSFGAGKVNFAIINVTHDIRMGATCDDIYIRDKNYSHGAIPFYILNCTFGRVSFLIPNVSLGGYSISAVRIFYDTRTGYSTFNNVSLLNKWFVGNGNLIPIGYNALPYIVEVSTGFNFNSTIKNPPHFDFQLGYDGKTYMTGYALPTARVNDTSGDPNKKILVYSSNLTTSIVTKRLSAIASSGANGHITNSTLSKPIAMFINGNILVDLRSPLSATAHLLASYTYDVGKIGTTSLEGTLANDTIPNGNNDLNLTPSGFVINPLLNVSAPITLYPNVTLPKGAVIVICLIFMLIIGFTMVKGHIYGAIIGLIALWLIVLRTLEPSFIFLALVITILLVIYVYTKKRGYNP
jgi:hypothetical protein